MISYAAVDALVTMLRGQEPPLYLDVDPAEVSPPGIWVRSAGIRFDLLGGYTHRLRLHLVVPDTGYIGARDALAGLVVQLLVAGVAPDGDVVEQPLVLPSSPKALPGLVFPLDLPDTYAQE